jgi:EAL domain-containing protein (putative c-di-GMP-specific phosphodiesterase class I)
MHPRSRRTVQRAFSILVLAWRSRVERLPELGSGIALDDFATGYSPPAYLTFPPDRLKIYRSFVLNVCHSARDVACARHTFQ